MNTIEIVNWREVIAPTHSPCLKWSMLNGGYSRLTSCRSSSNPRENRLHQVEYNREYVLDFITKKVFKALRLVDKKTAFQLLDEAWNYYEDLIKEDA